jgi:hypothetical protein
MHIQSFLPVLGMTIGLASHCRWWTSWMNPALSSFLISSWMKFCHSMDCFWGFCYTSLASGKIVRCCSINSLGIPGIYDGSQANTSTLARRKVMSVSSYLSPRFPMMRVVWVVSVLIWMTFTGMSSLSEVCTWGPDVESY